MAPDAPAVVEQPQGVHVLQGAPVVAAAVVRHPTCRGQIFKFEFGAKFEILFDSLPLDAKVSPDSLLSGEMEDEAARGLRWPPDPWCSPCKTMEKERGCLIDVLSQQQQQLFSELILN